MYKEYFDILIQAQKCLDYDVPVSEDYTFNFSCFETEKRIKGVYYYSMYEEFEGLTKEVYLSEEAFMGPTHLDFIP